MKRHLALILTVLLLITPLTACAKQEPLSITVWHYYTGALQEIFETAVADFNNTVGLEKGIILDSVNVEGIDILTENVIAASKNEVGADSLPDLIFAYNTTTYELDKLGLIADISPYFTQKELERYIPSFLDEGLSYSGELQGFPVAKSTEIAYYENVAYQEFKDALPEANDLDSKLATYEGIREIADMYFLWTDSQTPDIQGDGKAFFGIDSLSNYVSVSARQLTGVSPVTLTDGVPELTLDRDAAWTLWEYYMRGIVTGRFFKTGWYRSDDMKTGDLIGYLGSSGGANYFPTVVELDGVTYDTELLCRTAPYFAEGENFAIQQGAGIAIVKSDDRHQKAAAQFLKWFTDPTRNVPFAVASGYSPVQKLEYTNDLLDAALEAKGDDVKSRNIETVLIQAAEQMDSYQLFADRGYQGSSDVREMFGTALLDASTAARAAFLVDIAAGVAYDEAVDRQINAAAFTKWFEQIHEEFDELIAHNQ